MLRSMIKTKHAITRSSSDGCMFCYARATRFRHYKNKSNHGKILIVQVLKKALKIFLPSQV